MTLPGTGNHRHAIGIDLGGTKTEVALLAPDGALLFRERTATPRAGGYDAVLATVAAMTTTALALLPAGQSVAIGIGIPGSLDRLTGLVRNANSTCLIGKHLQTDLERILKQPLVVRNDADCFTLAECRGGAGQGFDLVFGIIIGTGCGGGLCINGTVREGPHRIGGEWGHLVVDPAGAACYCGNHGCVETLLSGSGVEERFYREHGERLTMEQIVSRARKNEPRCKIAFDHFLENFGRCVAGLISILDPDAVVIGGGFSNIDELYSSGYEWVRRYAFHDNLHTPLLRNRLGDSAGVLGAAHIALTEQDRLRSGG